jgi:predicted phosphate transport protein (TIGR00153 family)
MLVTRVLDGFYQAFEEQADTIVGAMTELQALMRSYEDVQTKVERIRTIEGKGDEQAAALLTHIERSRFTHQRDELRAITRALDDVLDAVDTAAESFYLYNIEQPSGLAIEMIELAAQCVRQVAGAVAVARKLQRRQVPAGALRLAVEEIKRIEDFSDQIHREAIGALFRHEQVVNIVKWKQVYDSLEAVLGACDDVGGALMALSQDAWRGSRG